MKWAIYGSKYDDYYGCCCCNNLLPDVVVATFDTKESAEKYLKKSKLKTPKLHNNFKSKSLLSPYECASVEQYCPPNEPTHEPELK